MRGRNGEVLTGDIVIWGLDTVDTARNGNQHMASSNGLIHLKALKTGKCSEIFLVSSHLRRMENQMWLMKRINID